MLNETFSVIFKHHAASQVSTSLILPIFFNHFQKPFQPATLPVSITETAAASTKHLKSGRRRSGSTSTNLLGDESDKSSSNF